MTEIHWERNDATVFGATIYTCGHIGAFDVSAADIGEWGGAGPRGLFAQYYPVAERGMGRRSTFQWAAFDHSGDGRGDLRPTARGGGCSDWADLAR